MTVTPPVTPPPTPPVTPAPALAVELIRKGWDIALTIVFLVLDLTFLVVGFLIELFTIAFTDVCPNSDCNLVSEAATAIFTSATIMAVVFVVAAIAAIVLLIIKRRGWWVAVAAGVVMLIVYIVGIGTALSIVSPTVT